jgi:hypothetical protein
MVDSSGIGGKFNDEGGLLLPFEEIQGIFQIIHPFSPPIKGGPLPPHSNTTHKITRASQSKSKSISTLWA